MAEPKPEPKPINGIWWVPVNVYHIGPECTDGSLLQGVQRSKFLIEADTAGEARISLRRDLGFWKNYNDLPPEKRRGVQPFRFRRGKIRQVLHCDKRFKNQDEDYTCGRPVMDIEDHEDRDDRSFNRNGEFGMCCLEGYDPSDCDCPYATERKRAMAS